MISGIPGPAAVGAKRTQRTAATRVRRKFVPVKYRNPARYLHRIILQLHAIANELTPIGFTLLETLPKENICYSMHYAHICPLLQRAARWPTYPPQSEGHVYVTMLLHKVLHKETMCTHYVIIT